MVIWILDCSTAYCTKVNLSADKEKELEETFYSNVEDFLCEHEKELGINMKYSSWMATNDENFDEKEF
jgi:hypothetical protein